MKNITIPTNPVELRQLFRNGSLSIPTAGLAPGYVQTNLAILPKDLAFDFLLFCQRNQKPCPLIEVLEAGNVEPVLTTPAADIRTDIGLYRVYKDGELVDELKDITKYWRDDLVSFLLGCSFTFETAMQRAGISLRHIDEDKNVSMYKTNLNTVPAGIFQGPMVMSMRPIKEDQVVKAVQVTSRYPFTHGAPLHVGNPETIGVKDLEKPDYGDQVDVKEGEVPVFWACGVTPQSVAVSSKPSLMITHSPGYMFITDLPEENLAVI